MKITLIAVGTKMPAWVTTGFEEYQRRFPKDMPFELIEIPAGKRGKNADIKRILEQEGKAMLAACGKGKVVTLDIPGKPWTTPQLAEQLEGWKNDGRDVCLLIGGPEGLSPECRKFIPCVVTDDKPPLSQRITYYITDEFKKILFCTNQ